MFVDDSACNLASINLMKFRNEDGSFDFAGFRAAARVFITAQEILVDHGSYPTDRIALNSHKFRPLGLGYANLGSLLMSNGLAYDSNEGRGMAASITAIMHGQAYLTSAEHAAHLGPFEGFPLNREPMLRVMEMHRDAVEAIGDAGPPRAVVRGRPRGRSGPSASTSGRKHGYRNSQVTVLASDRHDRLHDGLRHDTTEPDIAWVKYKSLAGGGMLKIRRTGPCRWRWKKLGYDEPAIRGVLDYVDAHDTIGGGLPGLKDEHLLRLRLGVLPRSRSRPVHFLGHLRMMSGAVQPFLASAIAKTCIVPNEVLFVADIKGVDPEGWRLGLKALAIYRDVFWAGASR